MAQSAASAHIPPELLQRIFAMLPHHEDIVHALMTCRAWHEVARDPMLWATYGARTGDLEAAKLFYGRCMLDSLTAEQWRQLVIDKACGRHCYQCMQHGHPRCAAGDRFRPTLCRKCSDNFQLGRASHRLLSKTEAMFRYKVRAKDLEALPHAAEANPINPSFSLMHLFRRSDVVRAAIKRWGSVAAMQKQVPTLPSMLRVLIAGDRIGCRSATTRL